MIRINGGWQVKFAILQMQRVLMLPMGVSIRIRSLKRTSAMWRIIFGINSYTGVCSMAKAEKKVKAIKKELKARKSKIEKQKSKIKKLKKSLKK